jgi:ketosteroid isomerase-like protein
MPTLERVRAFIAMVEAHDYVAAMEAFYHADATMQENLGAMRVGLPAMIEGEKGALQRSDIRARKVERFAIDGDHVFINWVFEMTPRAGGKTLILDEVAVQTWRGDRIAAERFYYDPKQMAPT